MPRGAGAGAVGVSGEGCAGGLFVLQVGLFAGDELHGGAVLLRGDVEVAGCRVRHRGRGDVGAAAAARADQRGALAERVVAVDGRIEQRPHLIVGHGRDGLLAQFRGEINEIVDGDALHFERRRPGREGLGWRQRFAGDD